MDSFFSNIFPWMGQQQKNARAAAQSVVMDMQHSVNINHSSPETSSLMDAEVIVEVDAAQFIIYDDRLPVPATSRKRNRRLSTPTLICTSGHSSQTSPPLSVTIVTPCHSDIDDDAALSRPKKMFRVSKRTKLSVTTTDQTLLAQDEQSTTLKSKVSRSNTATNFVAKAEEEARRNKTLSETPLDLLPEDILAHMLSFVNDVSNRFAIQCTSKQFHRISSTPEMMNKINVGGDPETGINGIILESDTKEIAERRLTPFASSGNLEAIYMLGIIKSYCDCDVECGISLLKMASSKGFVRASYALGLVLRDTSPDDAYYYMSLAADQKYLPALQELLSARDMKSKHGEPNADELRRHLDHLCLNRLLKRNYLLSTQLRGVNTSHCWNHLCGRWAYKASASSNSSNEAARSRFLSSTSADTNAAMCSLSDIQKCRVSRMKMCSRCCRAKYCSKLCQVYDWRSGRHKMECHFL